MASGIDLNGLREGWRKDRHTHRKARCMGHVHFDGDGPATMSAITQKNLCAGFIHLD